MGFWAKYYFAIIPCFFFQILFGQGFQVPVNSELAFDIEKKFYDSAFFHTSIKPYNLAGNEMFDYWQTPNKRSEKLKVFPVFSSLNKLSNDYLMFSNLGLGAFTRPHRKWSFQTSLYYAIFKYSNETAQRIDTIKYLPYFNKYNHQMNGVYGAFNFDFLLSYKPFRFLNISVGKSKLFFGDGYRSLFLSDNAPGYPFGNIVLDIWKIKYSVVYSFLNNYEYPDFSKEYRKYSTIHYLSYNISPKFNINIFEAVNWSGLDSINYRGFDINYLNPIIFFRPVEFSLDDPSPDNVLLGLGFKYRFSRNCHFYGQIFIDDFLLSEFKSNNGYWANKQGVQFGIRTYDVFKIKNLFFLSEVNLVRPFSYAHLSNLSSYSHKNEALAHPLGSNFLESFSLLRYRNEKFIFESKWIYAKFGKDTSAVSLGNNVNKPYTLRSGDYGHKLFQGNLNEMIKHQYRISYLLWPQIDLYAFAGINIEQTIHPVKETTAFFQFGITTYFSLYNPDYLMIR